MNIFFEVHQDLPREGPGDETSTLRALHYLKDLPDSPSFLDIACGPGDQTMVLASHSNGHFTAIDTHQPFLDNLARRANQAGLNERIKPLNISMFELQFTNQFDVIWSEGAIYIIGFAEGLKAWRRFVKPGGYVAVTELSWIRSDCPVEIADYWKTEYPGMSTVEQNLKNVQAARYQLLEYFTLPENAWWDKYYLPMEARINMLREKYRNNIDIQHELDTHAREIDMYKKYSAWYGYVFYVMKA